MNIETAKKIAITVNDTADILVFADILEELGDIRHNAVRKHSKCCKRGKGIIQNFSISGLCLSSDDFKDEPADENAKSNNPEEWMCLYD